MHKNGMEVPQKDTAGESKDQREIPAGYIPLYISIAEESLPHVLEHGFRVADNRVGEQRGGIIEEHFSNVARENNLPFDRTQCVFAYPRHPDKIPTTYTSDLLLQVYVDPTDCIVADGNWYSAAGREFIEHHPNHPNYLSRKLKECASGYWSEAKTLDAYLSEGHLGEPGDNTDFVYPEVLIPRDIPTNHMHLVNYTNTHDSYGLDI